MLSRVLTTYLRKCNIPISQAGEDFRAKVEGNIHNTNAEIQQGQTRIEQQSNPIKQEIKDEKGKYVTIRALNKVNDEAMGIAKDIVKPLLEPTITQEHVCC